MVPATAASAAAITNVIEMVRSTSTPTRAAIFWSCSQARCARPSEVLATRYQNASNSTAVMPDDELLIGQRHRKIVLVEQHELALDHRRDRLVARPLGDLDEIRQKDRHADRGNQRRQAERAAQRPIG